MTTRIQALTVFLKEDIREDDIEPLRCAIELFRDVSVVEKVAVTSEDMFARMRVRSEFHQKLSKLFEKDET